MSLPFSYPSFLEDNHLYYKDLERLCLSAHLQLQTGFSAETGRMFLLFRCDLENKC